MSYWTDRETMLAKELKERKKQSKVQAVLTVIALVCLVIICAEVYANVPR